MMERFDYKKEYKDLYLPKAYPGEVEVPGIQFIGAKGCGLPGSPEFSSAVNLLYSYTFSIKMSKMNGTQPKGYFEYVVPPLEAFFGTAQVRFRYEDKSTWTWTMAIRQPEFVELETFLETREILRKKKPGICVDDAQFFSFCEGRCAQVLHIGRYEDELLSLAKLDEYLSQHGYAPAGRHHEIYLSDPRRTKPEKCKTVLRIPVKKVF